MIIAVDIGNTSIHAGRFEGGRLRRQVNVPTPLAAQPRALLRRLAPILRAPERSRALICSVVPGAAAGVARALRQAGVRSVRVVGRDVKVPLKNRYAKPRQVGQDRLVGAYAAWCLYGDGARRRRSGGRNPERARKGGAEGGIGGGHGPPG